MELSTLPLGPTTARVWTAGAGEAIVLLHGPWAGAEAYWFKVADDLAKHYRVIAPELPGIGAPGDLLPSFGAYAGWLDALLEAMAVERAAVAGNALGASVAWRFAAQHPARCRALVMVNGYPPPDYPRIVRWMARHWPSRGWIRENLGRNVYGSAVLGLAFHDRANAPKAIVQALDHFSAAEIDAALDLLLAEDPPVPAPTQRTLLLFGEADRMAPFDKRGARTMREKLDHSRMVTIPAAGQLPQVEHPVAFVRALRDFLR
ncbi:MAG: alpha/beta hydrolase [Proteobacteria bacterium]|nr:alpha/beta hydrolase [Pseudomonadota bacterium]